MTEMGFMIFLGIEISYLPTSASCDLIILFVQFNNLPNRFLRNDEKSVKHLINFTEIIVVVPIPFSVKRSNLELKARLN